MGTIAALSDNLIFFSRVDGQVIGDLRLKLDNKPNNNIKLRVNTSCSISCKCVTTFYFTIIGNFTITIQAHHLWTTRSNNTSNHFLRIHPIAERTTAEKWTSEGEYSMKQKATRWMLWEITPSIFLNIIKCSVSNGEILLYVYRSGGASVKFERILLLVQIQLSEKWCSRLSFRMYYPDIMEIPIHDIPNFSKQTYLHFELWI